jgi:uncharacterized protein (TIGR02147 family)
MKTNLQILNKPRPVINEFVDPAVYLKAMIEYRKQTEASFSVMRATQTLRKISSTLVSLIIQKKRQITLDRAEELAKLMGLNVAEKMYFKNWLKFDEKPHEQKQLLKESIQKNKKEFAVTLLNDWLNVYVKDVFRLPAIQKNPELIYKELGTIASQKRIDQSLKFLLKEGYLRRTLDGRIVVETSLVSQEAPSPGPQIRAFHKAALSIARQNIDVFPATERFANTLVLDLTPERYQELVALIQEFSKNLQEFTAVENHNGDRLYQVLIHLTPTGGRVL